MHNCIQRAIRYVQDSVYRNPQFWDISGYYIIVIYWFVFSIRD